MENESESPRKGCVIKDEGKVYPRSFRLDEEVKQALEQSVTRLKEASPYPKKINESRLIKALIMLSLDMNTKTLLEAMKKVW